jgi:hypothetical protein
MLGKKQIIGKLWPWLGSILAGVGVLLIYLANQRTLAACDTIPNATLLFNLWQNQTFDMSDFVKNAVQTTGCYFLMPVDHPGGWVQLPADYQGRWISAYPIGPAIVTAPLYVLFCLHWKLLHGWATLDASLPSFQVDRLIYEKWAAATIAALSVIAFGHLARQFFQFSIALAVTLTFAFASTTWTTSAQGLWQHGPLNLLVILMLLGLVWAARSPRSAPWLLLAGVACGLIPGTRPPAIVFCVAALIHCLIRFRRQSGWFGCGCLSALSWLIWNTYWFQSPLLGSYAVHQGGLTLAMLPEGLPGVLWSPSRGLFVFSPILLFALPGMLECWRQRQQHQHGWLFAGLVLAQAAITFNYACFGIWWGGGSYGPRFMTDLLPGLCLLVGYGIQAFKRAKLPQLLAVPIVGLTLIAAIYSTLVQYAGAFMLTHNNWNASPVLVDLPQGKYRLWDWSDSQPQRALRALWYQRLRDQRSQPQAIQTFRGAVLSVSPSWTDDQPQTRITGNQNALLPLQVKVQNLSPYTWYGCDYGFGQGEIYLAGMVSDRNQRPILPIALSPQGRYAPQTIATVKGYIPLSLPPGHYQLRLWPGMIGVALPPPNLEAAYQVALEVL